VGFRSATAQSMRLRVQTGWLRLAFESDADFDSFTELL
jgi:hypothetical protein